MESMDLNTNLREIKNNAIITKTANAYVLSILDHFLVNNKDFTAVCDNFGLTEDELLIILGHPNISHISFLDEVAQYLVANQIHPNEKVF